MLSADSSGGDAARQHRWHQARHDERRGGEYERCILIGHCVAVATGTVWHAESIGWTKIALKGVAPFHSAPPPVSDLAYALKPSSS